MDSRTTSAAAAEVRRQAEERLARQSAAAAAAAEAAPFPIPQDPEALVHELRVHQIELEMQNEELRRVQLELQASHEKYFERFDLAPVGYLTLSEDGLVEDANRTAAGLLGVERDGLLGQPLSAFVLADDQDAYYLQRKQLAESGAVLDGELRFARPGDEPIWASLQWRPRPGDEDEPLTYHLTFVVVPERKQAERLPATS